MNPSTTLYTLVVLLLIVGCDPNQQKRGGYPPPSMTKEKFGNLPDGRSVDLMTLKNEKGVTAQVTNYGATLVALKIPDKSGLHNDVVLGYDDLKGYLNDGSYFGATVGRYANRIGNAQFSIGDEEYNLAKNDGDNHLHGGIENFSKKLWQVKDLSLPTGVGVQLDYFSKDLEEGYPGNLEVTVIYHLTIDNELKISYEAKTDQTTIVNFTHHSYFNLAGTGNILNHQLMIDANQLTEVGPGLIPTGKLIPVDNSPFDFKKPTVIGARINQDNDQLKLGNGYDHNWVLNGWDNSLRLAATLFDPLSGRKLSVHTTKPGLQVYTGNWLSNQVIGKSGERGQARQGICLEPQHFPDSPNQPTFPSVILNPGEVYKHQTLYAFSVQ